MISSQQICRARDARQRGRKTYSFARAGSLWVPKQHAAGIAMAFSPCFPSFDVGSQTPLEWVGGSNLVSWHDWALERTYNTTLSATGFTPPDITTTGTIPIGLGLEVRIATGFGGNRGVAKFDLSFNNGTTWDDNGGAHYTTAATFALSGVGTGVTLNFQNATYTDDNHYYLNQKSWKDQSGHGYHFVEDSTPNNPVPKVTPIGTALQFNSAHGILVESTGLAPTLAGGINNDWTMFAVVKIDNTAPTSGLGMILFLGSTSGNSWHYTGFNTTPDYICGKRDAAGATVNVPGGTPDTSVHVVEMVHELVSGTPTTTILIDGNIVAGPSAQTVSSLSLNVATIASSLIGAANGNTALLSYYNLLTYNVALDATSRGEIRQRLKSPYGIA